MILPSSRLAIAAAALMLAATTASAQFPTPSGGQAFPAYEGFDYTASSQLSAQTGWYIRDGADPTTVESGSLVPSNATVAAHLADATGGKAHVVTTTEGSVAGWYIGSTGFSNSASVFYISFLIQFDTDGGRNGIPYNGPIVGTRSFDSGNGGRYAIRGDAGGGSGGTNTGTDSALILRANSSASDVAGTVELDKNDTTYFIVMKCEAATSFGTNPTNGTLTVYLDPDPYLSEGVATVYQTTTENNAYANLRWLTLETDTGNSDYFIDEIRIGSTWEDVTPTKPGVPVELDQFHIE